MIPVLRAAPILWRYLRDITVSYEKWLLPFRGRAAERGYRGQKKLEPSPFVELRRDAMEGVSSRSRLISMVDSLVWKAASNIESTLYRH